jgi:hypothetical protein
VVSQAVTPQPAASVPAQDNAPSVAPGFGNQPASPKDSAGKSRLVNTDCKHIASDDEYAKLRKRMAAETDSDQMMSLAMKSFKKSCFTTDQVRNLSFLFAGEDTKYKFLEDAYPYVSDAWNFKSLQALFTTTYFINRFKALVDQR